MKSLCFALPLIFLSLVSTFSSSLAQVEDFFDHLTSNDGLSQNDVLCIYQDDAGFMWFGTNDGLNKYNGYSFQIFKPGKNVQSSIGGNLISSITQDQQGNIWIATLGYGISKYNPQTGRFINFKHEANQAHSLIDNWVSDVYCDQDNQLWVVTKNGLNMLPLPLAPRQNPKFRHFRATDPSSTLNHHAVFQDSKRRIWLGTNHGLYEVRPQHPTAPVVYRGMDRQNIRSIKESPHQQLLMATNRGIYGESISGEGKTIFQRLAPGEAQDLAIAPDQTLWAASRQGLYHFSFYHADSLQLIHHYTNDIQQTNSLSTNLIKSLCFDHTGLLWIGTSGAGIHTYDPNRKQFQHYKQNASPGSISQNIVRLIYEDSNETLWVGTKGGGLHWIPKKDFDGTFSNFRHLRDVSHPVSMCEVEEKGRKKLIVGTSNGQGPFVIDISRPNQKQYLLEEFLDLSSGVFSIHQDHLGQIWIGTYSKGLFKIYQDSLGLYKKEQYLPETHPGLASAIIRNIYQDQANHLWIGTGQGLCQVTPDQIGKKSPRFTKYQSDPQNPNSLSHNYVLSILETQAGELWVGTLGGGLNKYVKNSKTAQARFLTYTEEDGLPNNTIKGILEDEKGFLWISTNLGISKFDPRRKTFKNYDVNDGLQANEFQELTSLKRKDGQMLFGGVNGFNVFYPKQIEDNEIPPKVLISRFSLWDEEIRPGQEVHGRVLLDRAISQTEAIRLKYYENSISFDFAALHYTAPSKNQYAYRLLGFNKEWTTTSATKRFASYTNLSPGRYTFEVKASNNDGLWSEEIARVHVRILPPFWQTWPAYVLYVLLGIAFLYTFRTYTIIANRKKHQLEMEHLEREKTEELHKMKLQFFTNISHEFRTPLSLINGPIRYLIEHQGNLEQEAQKKQHQLILKNTKVLTHLINQLLEFRKIEQNGATLEVVQEDIITFIKEKAEAFSFVADEKQIDYRVESTLEHRTTWFSPDALEKVLANLLSNAFKFTPEGGKIRLRISPKNLASTARNFFTKSSTSKPYLEVRVEDSGEGIDPKKADQIFERFFHKGNTYQRNVEGAGIGLALTKSLVELHHGNIYVDKSYTEGTGMVFLLPLFDSAYRQDKKLTMPEIIKATPEPAWMPTQDYRQEEAPLSEAALVSKKLSQKPLVMLVEDNPDMRNHLKLELTPYYQIVEASHGREALDKLKTNMPSIIICDVMMPEMDGISFSKQIKSSKAFNHIPIIFLTAKSSHENELEGLRSGANDYITKPYDVEALRIKLSNILENRARLREYFQRELTLEPSEVQVTSQDESFLNEAMEVVERNMTNDEFNVETFVKEMGISRSSLYMKFKELTGLSTSEFIRNIRLKRAEQLLLDSDLSVKEVMYMTGFNTPSYFTKCFKKQFGISPSEYKNQIET